MNQFLGFLGGVLLTPFIIRSLGSRTDPMMMCPIPVSK